MSPDTVFITTMRDPATQVMSAFKFYHPNRIKNISMSVHEFLQYPMVKKGMLYVKIPHQHLSTKSKRERFISQNLEPFFTLVLIKKYFDESLVLLRRTLCWDLEDIIYCSLKMSTKKMTVSEKDTAEIRQRMVGDLFCNFYFTQLSTKIQTFVYLFLTSWPGKHIKLLHIFLGIFCLWFFTSGGHFQCCQSLFILSFIDL